MKGLYFFAHIKKARCFLTLVLLASLALLFSCSKKSAVSPADFSVTDITLAKKNHSWYYFTDNSFSKIDLPQNSPEVLERPWTEAVRISAAGGSYALVNHLGLLSFSKKEATLYMDTAIFSGVTADSLVFSEENPVFYLYRSAFFNRALEKEENPHILPSRPFLVEFNKNAHAFFPLVTYQNLGLGDDEEVTGYFWDGTLWSCAAKRTSESRVDFSYFYWEPTIPLTDFSPALSNADIFSFAPSSELEYRNTTMPRSFSKAPPELKALLSSIPDNFPFLLYWKDGSGTSPVQFIQTGNSPLAVTANAAFFPEKGYAIAIFADGTTFVQKINEYTAAPDNSYAFRLPLLPADYSYGDFAFCDGTVFVSWEQTSFYKTARAGFLSVDVEDILEQIETLRRKNQF